MKEIVEILYRELHYRRLKSNPRLSGDPEKFRSQLEQSGNLKRGLIIQSLIFLLFGGMMAAGVWSAEDSERAAVIFATYSLLTFVMALYTTTVNTSYAISMGIFDPLKPLPIRTGPFYLSALLAIDNTPAIVALIPASLGMAYRSPISGFLGFLWVLVGAFLGHVFGLLLFYAFGSSRRLSGVKTAARVIGIILFLGIFYAINYVQAYVNHHYQELLPIFSRYSVAYPFSVASITSPTVSALLLTGYIMILVPSYRVLITRLWMRTETGASSSREAVSFKASTHSPVVALFLKDLRVVMRKSPLLVGLLIPVFMALPAAIGSLTSGKTGGWGMAYVLLMIAWVTSMGVDAVLKTDGRSFEFLLALPIDLRQFLLGKLLLMNAVPVLTGASLVLIVSIRTLSALAFLPAAFILPLLTSSITLFFIYRGESAPSTPDTDFGLLLLLLLLNGAVLGSVALLWYFVGYSYALLLSLGLLLLIWWVMWRR